jgi:hypothetical protein
MPLAGAIHLFRYSGNGCYPSERPLGRQRAITSALTTQPASGAADCCRTASRVGPDRRACSARRPSARGADRRDSGSTNAAPSRRRAATPRRVVVRDHWRSSSSPGANVFLPTILRRVRLAADGFGRVIVFGLGSRPHMRAITAAVVIHDRERANALNDLCRSRRARRTRPVRVHVIRIVLSDAN